MMIGGRPVRGFGLGDPSALGVSVDASGVQWDPGALASQLPQGAQQLGTTVINGAAAARDAKTQAQVDALAKSTEASALGIIAIAGFPYGTVAAALVALINSMPGAGEGHTSCCDDNSCAADGGAFGWEARYGTYDPGTPGSFTRFANTALRMTYDALVLPPGSCTTGKGLSMADVQAQMATVLATVIAQWNATHDGSSIYQYTVPHTSQGVSGGFTYGVPGAGDPIAVTVNSINVAAKGPGDTTFRFPIHSGPPTAPMTINPSVIAQQPTSAGKKTATVALVAAGTAVGGLWWYAARKGVSMGQALRGIFR